MKLYIYPIASIMLTIASRLLSHHVHCTGWSIAMLAAGFISLGIYAWKCDKQANRR